MLKVAFLFFLSISSFNGIAFEPYFFKHFRVADGLPSTEVYQIIQDSEGYLWFATDRGVSRYDGYRFQIFTREDGLTDEVVFGFYPEENGRLWFYTYNGGVCYYSNGQIIEPDFNTGFKALLEELQYPVITNLYVDESGNVWVGSESKYIFKITPAGEINTLEPTTSAEYPHTTIIETGNSSHPNLVYSTPKGSFKSSVVSFYTMLDSLSHIASLSLTSQAETSRNRAKVYRIDRHTFIYSYGSYVFKIVNGRVEQQIHLGKDQRTLYALHIDQDNALWVGTQQGVYRFENSDLQSKPRRFLTSQPVSSVWQDHEGGLWFSSLKDGVFYLPHFQIQSSAKSQIGDNKLVQIGATPYGVYAASMSENICIFPHGRLADPVVIPNSYSNGSSFTIWGDYIMSRISGATKYYFRDSVPLKEAPFFHYPGSQRNDDRSDYLWMHNHKTFYLISESLDSVISAFEFNHDRVRCAAVSRDRSKVWIGLSSGLYLYNNGKITNMGERIPQFNGRISDLDVISDRELLITTRGNGVLLYNFRNNTSVKLEEVPNEYCNQSYVDPDGVVWIATFSGVTRVSDVTSEHPTYHHFSTHNGLISNEVYGITEFDGDIWIATGAGISKWSRTWIPEKENSPVTVNRCVVNNADINPQSLAKLSANENHLQFYFSSISFREPMEYHYRLKGLHANWIHTINPSATYSALKPGQYTFELKPANATTVHSSISLSIAPPFWYSIWFLSSLGIALMTGIILVLRIRYRVILKENKLYGLFLNAEQKALRAQINPHFLFNTFNSILELLMRKDYRSARKYMSRFSRVMRMVLQYSRREEIVLSDEMELLRLYLQLEKLRFGSMLHFHLEVHPNLNTEVTVLPSMLLQPYVENALNHGIRSRLDNKGSLRISFAPSAGQLLVRIEDNGKGYDHTSKLIGRKKSYGMKINGDRIDLFRQKEHLDIHILPLYPGDKQYPGTVVELRLPLKTKTNYEITPV